MIEVGMAVQYGAPDLFPQTWALYVCPCGRIECEHGRNVAEPPRGWHQVVSDENEMAICPTCWSAGYREVAPPSE
jgi:hypothetical protein